MTDKPVHACTFTIDEWMREDVVTLPKDATVREALTAMLDNKTNGVVIVDDNRHVIGILSSWDIIKYIGFQKKTLQPVIYLLVI